ncbi:MAG TPA: ATP-binding protein [Xanthobacteraceae bacterium]|jgi:PAS domain S-box-containing protein|nr:ATP-binding protein [Xanthobacteraceae bacterium]
MPIVEKELTLLRHPRIAPLAASAWPAWLWSIDGRHIVWANAAGAAIFGAATTQQCRMRHREIDGAAAAQIVRLAATLPSMAQNRLERLRGFGANFGRALTCICSRIVLDDGKAAVLVAAAEPAGPNLAPDERVRRLFGGCDEPLAAFAPDGRLVYANAAALTQLDGVSRLSALGIEPLAAAALQSGHAEGSAQRGDKTFAVTVTKLGSEATQLLVLTIMPQQISASADAPAAPQDVHDTPATEAVSTTPAPAPLVPSAGADQKDQQPDAAQNSDAAATPETLGERRHPLRFVWHMDADGRFGVGSDEFIELAGPHTATAFGRPWHEIAGELKLDPNNQVARAVASRETWSGITVSWPVDWPKEDSTERLPIEMSGLPVFDRDRSFRGYRGFGVCRDVDRLNQLARARREHPMGFMPPAEDPPQPSDTAAALSAAAPKEPVAPVAPAPVPPERPAAPAVSPSANVVPFRPSAPAETKVPPALSPVERRAFRELAQELTARLHGPEAPATETGVEEAPAEAVAPAAVAAAEPIIEQVLLDRIPIGVLVYRHDKVLYANRHFLEWSGYASLAAIEAAGGLTTLFAEPDAGVLAASDAAPLPIASLSIVTERGETVPVQGRMFTVPWSGSTALALILTNGQAAAAQQEAERALGIAQRENHELKSTLDIATDGVVILDAGGRAVAANARALGLFGKAADELTGRGFSDLLAPESEHVARAYFDRVVGGGADTDDAIDVAGRGAREQLLPLAMALGRIDNDRFCAVFRDVTSRKHSEEELRNARRETLRAASAKAEFLARVSHDIRTPLNAMIGFAEVIMAERLGPIGHERYREYIKDIHAAGTHLVSMLNDLSDLSRVETGQIELNFTSVALNELTQQCVGIMQPQANRARIIIRTSLTPGIPPIVADERSLRQIVLNLIANSIRFTGPGGQVIVSTLLTDSREVVLRVRDTGAGMSEKDIELALEPFRQTATSGSWGSGGSGLGLPLTKALAEANRANFSIKSAPNAGTLVEIAFPSSRLAAG